MAIKKVSILIEYSTRSDLRKIFTGLEQFISEGKEKDSQSIKINDREINYEFIQWYPNFREIKNEEVKNDLYIHYVKSKI
jgi:hypothetical protein